MRSRARRSRGTRSAGTAPPPLRATSRHYRPRRLAPPGGGWRDLLADVAQGLRRALRAHPGAAAVVAVRHASPQVFERAVPTVLAAMNAGLRVTDEEALYLVQSLYILVTGHALAEFGDTPEPPAAPTAYYDAWFDIAVSTFLAGVEARYGA
ncbi:TetR/AcrR family transcriptional regulator C-terminal domain-containing protein [Microbispora sp. H10885]|uniref:TetR/AcrR family transcriptional regulator C-terminal domain-containing protein n=1 Tax=Microbispora sp. H10885 TaxID=2729110 RepID=UPI002175E1F6|nr:TetR/AcrR family transcriptional regulator C-terminal domain-containing protein [Microbispora sp. H10885]